MRNYILRNVNAALWSKVKARASKDGLTIRAVILALLNAYAERHVSVGQNVAMKSSEL